MQKPQQLPKRLYNVAADGRKDSVCWQKAKISYISIGEQSTNKKPEECQDSSRSFVISLQKKPIFRFRSLVQKQPVRAVLGV